MTQEQTGRDPAAGFGANGKPDFWIGGEGGLNKPLSMSRSWPGIAQPYARSMRRLWRRADAIMVRPGIRAHYHPDYYGAFVLDPDGHNIEAVCHAPPA